MLCCYFKFNLDLWNEMNIKEKEGKKEWQRKTARKSRWFNSFYSHFCSMLFVLWIVFISHQHDWIKCDICSILLLFLSIIMWSVYVEQHFALKLKNLLSNCFNIKYYCAIINFPLFHIFFIWKFSQHSALKCIVSWWKWWKWWKW